VDVNENDNAMTLDTNNSEGLEKSSKSKSITEKKSIKWEKKKI